MASAGHSWMCQDLLARIDDSFPIWLRSLPCRYHTDPSDSSKDVYEVAPSSTGLGLSKSAARCSSGRRTRISSRTSGSRPPFLIQSEGAWNRGSRAACSACKAACCPAPAV
ncbi:uncharacterized protein PFL1_00564 [Pseudozyma flocculosa PF-1]|uniref:uncharacterized protein n=1 Tax=Pseudozyma flocculosa PF-1 TaxID=1277687 RepID=UPI0004560748|nr:uncharacterized protein PFL1_00564 [Pseudozyma flocculosa PF-1]EPQ32368.1 hypothetical protein PFL1_00564 [Pseudozyma flocculosa PF-1]